jgi:hemolysin III
VMSQEISSSLDNFKIENVKPLLRGWFHAAAALAAVALTIALCWRSSDDLPRLFSMLIFGLSMIALYTVSAIYNIGNWGGAVGRCLRSLDHANIFLLIAGTYTPICFNVLHGWVRYGLLLTIWLLAVSGVALAIFTVRVPRWVRTGLYIGMGWVGLLALPALGEALAWEALALLFLGGLFYTVGAVIYGCRRPNPFPRVFGFHEIFHLFVIAGGMAFTASIWFWALPFPRI